MVSHGGSGGLYPAMAAGTPVLGIPRNADQHMSTAILEESGAGLVSGVEEASESACCNRSSKLLYRAAVQPERAQEWATVYRPLQQRRTVPEVYSGYIGRLEPEFRRWWSAPTLLQDVQHIVRPQSRPR